MHLAVSRHVYGVLGPSRRRNSRIRTLFSLPFLQKMIIFTISSLALSHLSPVASLLQRLLSTMGVIDDDDGRGYQS